MSGPSFPHKNIKATTASILEMLNPLDGGEQGKGEEKESRVLVEVLD